MSSLNPLPLAIHDPIVARKTSAPSHGQAFHGSQLMASAIAKAISGTTSPGSVHQHGGHPATAAENERQEEQLVGDGGDREPSHRASMQDHQPLGLLS